MSEKFFKSLPLDCRYDPIFHREYKGVRILAPESFWDADQELIDSVVGGCGPGWFGNLFVPNNLLGVKIKIACQIHDWCFLVWNDKKGFRLANNIFNRNMNMTVSQKTKTKWLKKPRLWVSVIYYQFVHRSGGLGYKDNHLKFV